MSFISRREVLKPFRRQPHADRARGEPWTLSGPPRYLNIVNFQTRMVHTKPYEMLLPMKSLSGATEKMIKHFTEYVHRNTLLLARLIAMDEVGTRTRSTSFE